MAEVRYSSLILSTAVIGVYLLQILFPPVSDLSFVASDFLLEPWTILTSIFLHNPGDYMHLLNNLFFLAVFGFMLENIVGTRRFLSLYMFTGVFANLSAFVFYPSTPVLGASGAISGIIAALAVIRPRDVGLFWGVPVPMWAALLGWVVTNLTGAAASGGGIAFEAHLFGLASGALLGLFMRREHSRSGQEDPEIQFDVEEWEEEHMR
ncbi:MAG: rhomboid family intramembrane serine protease [Candidatus Nanohaloarchaeota archaeon QJJ-7]|nr:rhomboid family intramembrane serine protease [Candidatus Nanohaloarchaeota archaeon QJJ-7]